MKKIMYLCLMMSVMSFISCSSDDDGGQDPVIGKWQYTSIVEFKGGKQQPTRELSDCEKKSWVEFTVEGKGSLDFYEVDNSGKCTGDDPINTFTWVNKGNNVYGLSANDDREEEVMIVLEGKTMTMTVNYEDGGVKYSDILTYTKIK